MPDTDFTPAIVDFHTRRLAITWQPIETAPKDGTPILAYETDWGYPISIRWHQPWQSWVLNGVLLKLGDWGEPTHWMPLPAPPRL